MVLEIKLNVSENFAEEAKAKGLLEPAAVEEMLRAELRRKNLTELFSMADRLAAVPGERMTEAEVQAEVNAVRAERRAKNARRS
jgi:hypothetical protein